MYCGIHASVLWDTRGRRPRGNKLFCYVEAGSSFFASQPSHIVCKEGLVTTEM